MTEQRKGIGKDTGVTLSHGEDISGKPRAFGASGTGEIYTISSGSYAHIAVSGSQLVKAAAGYVRTVNLNSAGKAAQVTLFNCAATASTGSANTVGIYDVLVTNDSPRSMPIYATFNVGIVLSSSVDFDSTVIYQ